MAQPDLSQYQYLVFVDNDESVRESFKKGYNAWPSRYGPVKPEKVLVIDVHDNGQEKDDRIRQFNHPEMIELKRRLSENAQHIWNIHSVFWQSDYFDITSGIQAPDTERILEWVQTKKAEALALASAAAAAGAGAGAGAAGGAAAVPVPKPRIAVVFDMDRTLSQVEGFSLPYNPKDTTFKKSFDDFILEKASSYPAAADYYQRLPEELKGGNLLPYFVEYCFGGYMRLGMIQSLIQSLAEEGVDFYVETNNPTAKLSPTLIHEILRVVFEDTPFTLIYSGGGPFYGNKRKCLSEYPDYEISPFRYVLDVDPYKGGRRRPRRRTTKIKGKAATARQSNSRQRRQRKTMRKSTSRKTRRGKKI